MKCRDIKISLYDYEKDEVSPEERAAINLHLKDCSACAKELEEIRSLRNIFASGLQEPPVSILRGIRNAVKPENANPFKLLFSPFRIAGAAVAFVVLLLLITLNILNTPKHEDPTENFMLESYSVTGYALNYEDTEYYDHLSDIYQ